MPVFTNEQATTQHRVSMGADRGLCTPTALPNRSHTEPGHAANQKRSLPHEREPAKPIGASLLLTHSPLLGGVPLPARFDQARHTNTSQQTHTQASNMHANEHAHTTHATAFDRHAGGAARSHAGHAHDPIQQGPIQETPTMSGDQANAPAGAPVGGDWLQRVTDVLLASVELAEAESRQVYRKGHAWCAQLAIGIAAGFLLLMAVGALTASVWYLGNFVSGPILGWAMAGGMLTLVGVAVGLIALFWPSRLRHA